MDGQVRTGGQPAAFVRTTTALSNIHPCPKALTIRSMRPIELKSRAMTRVPESWQKSKAVYSGTYQTGALSHLTHKATLNKLNYLNLESTGL